MFMFFVMSKFEVYFKQNGRSVEHNLFFFPCSFSELKNIARWLAHSQLSYDACRPRIWQNLSDSISQQKFLTSIQFVFFSKTFV